MLIGREWNSVARLLRHGVGAAGASLRRAGLLEVGSAVLFLALAGVLITTWNNRLQAGRYVVATEVSTHGFVANGGAFHATSGAGDLHLISASIPIKPGSGYIFSLEVTDVPDEPVDLHVDLFGAQYDNPEQEQVFKIGYESGAGSISGRLDSDDSAPAFASLRIFYTGPVGLSVQNIQIAAVPLWRIHLQVLVIGCFVLSLSVLIICVARRLFAVLPGQTIPGQQGTLAAIPISLVALYPLAVLGRFLVALALPYWSGDEYVYKALAAGIWAHGRAGAISPDQIAHSVEIPNLLYPYMIAPALALGEDFYLGIRLINAFVISAAVFPAFAIARRFVAQRPALVIALLAVVLPSANISAYAVTEVLYHPLFITCVWLAMRAIDRPGSFWCHAALGMAAGILLNVRMTAVVIVPAYLISLAMIALQERSGERLWRRPMWVAVIVVAVLTWHQLSSFLAGDRLSGLGVYESQSGGWISSAFSAMVADPVGTWRILAGHLTILTVPYSIGIATAFAIVFSASKSETGVGVRRDAVVLMCFFMLSLGLAVVFTLGVSSTDLGGFGRWHSRYYFSALPLLFVAAFMITDRDEHNRLAAWPYWLVIAAHSVGFIYFIYYFKGLDHAWFGSTVDSMEVQWFRIAWGLPGLLFAATIVTAYLHWKFRRTQLTAGLVLVWVMLANYGSLKTLRRGPGADAHQCGRMAFHMLAQSPGKIVALASTRAALVDIVFWLPLLPERSIIVPEGGSPFDASELAGLDYLATDGAVNVVGVGEPMIPGRCRIYSLR